MCTPRFHVGCFLLSAAAFVGCEPLAERPEDMRSNGVPPATNPVRFASGRVVFRQSSIEAHVREALGRAIAGLKYEQVQLDAVADDLSRTNKIPIALDIAALTADGKGAETLITVQVATGTTLRNALHAILDDQGLTFAVSDDRLLITTKTAAEADRFSSIRVYQVDDLVGPAGSSASFESLIELITSTIHPESWREAGGTQGEIKAFRANGLSARV